MKKIKQIKPKNINIKRNLNIRELPIGKVLPNIITLTALCTGLSAVRFALNSRWELAVSCILIAAILDGTDGRIARFLGTTSHFGAELDSLVDFVNFGVSPAILMYLCSMKAWSSIGWGICLFFVVCCGLRLARFNTDKIMSDTPKHNWENNFSTGVAAPAGAISSLIPLILYFETKVGLFITPLFSGIFIILTGFLMISKIPTFVFKQIKIKQKFAPFVVILISSVVIFLVAEPWGAIAAISIVYLCLIPYSIHKYNKMKSAKNDLSENEGIDAER